MEVYIIIIFVAGYLLIALEHPVKINKAATALVTGVLCWTLFALDVPGNGEEVSDHFSTFQNTLPAALATPLGEIYSAFIKSELSHHLSQISGILFFLMGAMTIVELIDAHQGFQFITNMIKTTSLRKLMWIICWVTFFLSAILDNLTTAIVMVSLTRKLVHHQQSRLLFAGMIVIAANAGGAWSPIGDVTTTMLWIGGQVSSGAIISSVFLPSIVCMLLPLLFLHFTMKDNAGIAPPIVTAKPPRGSLLILATGIGALVSVPIFKTVTHLPPYMGILLGLGVLWVVSEFVNPGADEADRHRYSAAHALSRIDSSSVLFFMGILLAVGALESMQTLHRFAAYLDDSLGNQALIISMIGVLSAIVDNVPLVAACMGMYSMETYPMDHTIWQYLAYCAGTGGSLLIIGSAAGVAVMGMEKIDFVWYIRKVTLLAFIGYAGGAGMYLLMH